MMQKGGDIGIITVECLRGRLQAERVASKAARDEADLMANRLGELERKLEEEIKSRNRAEKRLKHALKKLESLKLLSLSESSAGSSESWKSIHSRMQDMRRVKGLKGTIGDDGLDSTSSGDSGNNQMTSQEGSWSSIGTGHSDSKESVTDDLRQAEASVNSGASTNSAVKQPDYSDDTLALVPVKSTYSNIKNSDDVHNVLIALRTVKEKLRNSLDRRATALSSPKLLYGQ